MPRHPARCRGESATDLVQDPEKRPNIVIVPQLGRHRGTGENHRSMPIMRIQCPICEKRIVIRKLALRQIGETETGAILPGFVPEGQFMLAGWL